jgi:hypothetical protein
MMSKGFGQAREVRSHGWTVCPDRNAQLSSEAPPCFCLEIAGRQRNIIWAIRDFWLARRLLMQQYFLAAIWCMFLVTGIAAYIPLMYIRKTDKILKLLQQIEANTARKL